MTVYRGKRRRTYDYDFVFEGQRYIGNTKQTTQADAELVESQIKLALRQAAGGIAIVRVEDTPTLQHWFEIYAEHVRARGKVTRPERIDDLIRVALRFWGRKPAPNSKLRAIEGEPYHDLRLGHVVKDPSWILKWEQWLAVPHIDGKGRVHTWSGQTKNQYRSLVNQAFKLAMRPEWRQKTHITQNPFVGTERDPAVGRTVSLEREELLTIIACASWHLRIALAVAALSPKLRQGNILALRFDEHFSPDLQYVTVHKHKTKRSTGKPLVAYVPEQLRRILLEARRRSASGYVVEYGGKPVTELRGAVRGAVARAAEEHPHLRYGRATAQGITFHTLRHTASTLMVDLGIGPDERMKVVGHARIDTQIGYSHLRPRHEATAQEKLSAHLPMEDLVLQKRRRAPRASIGKTTGTAPITPDDSGQNPSGNVETDQAPAATEVPTNPAVYGKHTIH